MKRLLILGLVAVILAVVSVAGCANLTPTQQHAFTGDALGTAAGAALGGTTGVAAGALWKDVERAL